MATTTKQGHSIVAPFIAAVLGFIFFMIPAFSCDTFRYEDEDGFKIDHGYWGMEDPIFDTGTCIEYTESDDLGPLMKVGRGAAVAGAILGGTAVVGFVVVTFFVRMPPSKRSIFLRLPAVLMVLATLLLYANMFSESCFPSLHKEEESEDYYWDWGEDEDEDEKTHYCMPTGKGYLAAPAFVCWIVAASLLSNAKSRELEEVVGTGANGTATVATPEAALPPTPKDASTTRKRVTPDHDEYS